MDRLQHQLCRKTSEDRNITWNKKCDKVCSSSELNEIEKLVLSLDGKADNPYLYTRVDVGNGEPKCQQYKYRESKQNNSQLTEEDSNFAFMNTPNENVAFYLSFGSHFSVPQLGNLLRVCLWVV
ncbi:hypothetical protein AVEN_113006-1 [Araneus ventricosus]|uniref:Uncharacterized protein n=1 Tax=Araneus ventricosus TaxID=182803 RepID=A0A4Y2LDL8_ARAVE|nr:hypothetical protein AVEN_113006-1 [Araneus ventricosus]